MFIKIRRIPIGKMIPSKHLSSRSTISATSFIFYSTIDPSRPNSPNRPSPRAISKGGITMSDIPNYDHSPTLVRLFGRRIWTVFCLTLCLVWAVLFGILFIGADDSLLRFMFYLAYLFFFPCQLFCFFVLCLVGLFGQKKILSALIAIALFVLIFISFPSIAKWSYQRYDDLRWKLGIPIQHEEMLAPQRVSTL